MSRFIPLLLTIILSLGSCELNSSKTEHDSPIENIDHTNNVVPNKNDTLNKIEVFYHGASDVGEKLELYPNNTFYLSHWNTFGTPYHKYGTYAQIEDQLILTDTFGYIFDFSSKKNDSTIMKDLTVDTLYYWPADKKTHLSPYSEKTSKEFDYYLFWRKDKEIKLIVNNGT